MRKNQDFKDEATGDVHQYPLLVHGRWPMMSPVAVSGHYARPAVPLARGSAQVPFLPFVGAAGVRSTASSAASSASGWLAGGELRELHGDGGGLMIAAV